MYDHVDVVVRNAEEMVSLDDLEALVDERRAVDRDDRAHVPGRVRERLLGRHAGELVAAAAAERAAARGQDEPPHLVGASAAKALSERRVLRVDRHDLTRSRPAGDEVT